MPVGRECGFVFMSNGTVELFFVQRGFMWIPLKIRASPNYRATAQAGAAIAAPCDSFDGDPQETQKDQKTSVRGASEAEQRLRADYNPIHARAVSPAPTNAERDRRVATWPPACPSLPLRAFLVFNEATLCARRLPAPLCRPSIRHSKLAVSTLWPRFPRLAKAVCPPTSPGGSA